MASETEIGMESPVIAALGSLLKITEVYLTDNAPWGAPAVPSDVSDVAHLDVEAPKFHDPGVITSNNGFATNGYCLSLEEMELAEEMSALGLPISFITNKEKKNSSKKGKQKGVQSKTISDHEQIVSNTYLEITTESDPGSALDANLECCPERSGKKPEDFESCEDSVAGECDMEVKKYFCERAEHFECNPNEVAGCHNGLGDWEVAWDDYYMRYYYYNSKTQESTWDPPSGTDGSAGVDESTNNSDVKDADICQDPFLNSQDNIDRLQVVVNQLTCCEVLVNDPKLAIMKSNENEMDICDYKDGGEESSTVMEIEKMDDPKSKGGMDCGNDPAMEVLDDHNDFVVVKRKRKQKQRSQKKHTSNVHKEVLSEPLLEGLTADIVKYWCQRYLLFSRFDEGIKMDVEGWFSVTPEAIARHHATRCGGGITIDCFAGVGGNAIHFARKNHVLAIDIDPQKIEYARHNATVYGVVDSIDFVCGDIFQLFPKLKGNTVFLSPPWGGPDYAKVQTYDIKTMLKPHDGYFLFKIAKGIASRIVMFLPRSVDVNQLAEIAWLEHPHWALEVEKNFLNGKLKAITAYFTQVQNQEQARTCK
ncbi:hypothetical protein H6P81_011003 [Aristolochia fimbriata]|uniref:Trimethylguanosine synthase n=1 Tax=Aristolochia fimbriata TaxID=158543 RepID=A0AAV7EUS8_ARIFI|nr:hypothetical protein H6P81_011003 [Aristolochia fimbriata]